MSGQTEHLFYLLEPYLFFGNYSGIKYDDIKQADKFECIYKLLFTESFKKITQPAVKLTDENIEVLKQHLNTDSFYGLKKNENSLIKNIDDLEEDTLIKKNVCYLSNTKNKYFITSGDYLIAFNFNGHNTFYKIPWAQGDLLSIKKINEMLRKTSTTNQPETTTGVYDEYYDRIKNILESKTSILKSANDEMLIVDKQYEDFKNLKNEIDQYVNDANKETNKRSQTFNNLRKEIEEKTVNIWKIFDPVKKNLISIRNYYFAKSNKSEKNIMSDVILEIQSQIHNLYDAMTSSKNFTIADLNKLSDQLKQFDDILVETFDNIVKCYNKFNQIFNDFYSYHKAFVLQKILESKVDIIIDNKSTTVGSYKSKIEVELADKLKNISETFSDYTNKTKSSDLKKWITTKNNQIIQQKDNLSKKLQQSGTVQNTSNIEVSTDALNNYELYEHIIKSVTGIDPIVFTKYVIANYASNILQKVLDKKCSFDGVMLEVFLDRIRYFTNPDDNKYYDEAIYDTVKKKWFEVNKMYYSEKSLQLPETFNIDKTTDIAGSIKNITFALKLEEISFDAEYIGINKLLVDIYATKLDDITLENAHTYINSNISFMEQSISLLKRYIVTDVAYWILLTRLVKVPMNIYNALQNLNSSTSVDNLDTDNKIVSALCKLFGEWLNVTSRSNLSHVYKFAYYLIVHKLLNKFINKVPIRSKNMYNDFVIACGNIEIFDSEMIFDINILKSSILTLKPIWFANTEDYVQILSVMYESLGEKNTDTSVLAKRFLNSNLEETKKEKPASKVVFENAKIGGWTNQYELGTQLKMNSYRVTFDHTCMLFYFPEIDKDLVFELHETLAWLLQFINVCKMENIQHANFPYTTPCNATMSVGNELGKYGIDLANNTVTYTVSDINIQSLLPKEQISTSMNISTNDHKLKAIHDFTKFMQTEDVEYLKDIFPFMKVGFGLKTISDEINLAEKDLLNVKNILQYTDPSKTLSTNEYSNDTIFSNNDMYSNFMRIDNISTLAEKINASNISKKYYNIYMFMYLLITNDNNIENIIEAKIFTSEELNDFIEKSHDKNMKDSEESIKCTIMSAFSNAIKYYTVKGDTNKCMTYLRLLNKHVMQEKNKEKVDKTMLDIDNDMKSVLEKICILNYNVPRVKSQHALQGQYPGNTVPLKATYGQFVNFSKVDTMDMSFLLKKLYGEYTDADRANELLKQNSDTPIKIKDVPEDPKLKPKSFYNMEASSILSQKTGLTDGDVEKLAVINDTINMLKTEFLGQQGAGGGQGGIDFEDPKSLEVIKKWLPQAESVVNSIIMMLPILTDDLFETMVKSFIENDNNKLQDTKKAKFAEESLKGRNESDKIRICNDNFVDVIGRYIVNYANGDQQKFNIIDGDLKSTLVKSKMPELKIKKVTKNIPPGLHNFNYSLILFLASQYRKTEELRQKQEADKKYKEKISKKSEELVAELLNTFVLFTNKDKKFVTYYPNTELNTRFYFYIGKKYTIEKCTELANDTDKFLTLIKKKQNYVDQFNKVKSYGAVKLNMETIFFTENIDFPLIKIFDNNVDDKKFTLEEIFMQHISMFLNKRGYIISNGNVSGYMYNNDLKDVLKIHAQPLKHIQMCYVSEQKQNGNTKIYYKAKFLHNILTSDDIHGLLEYVYGNVGYDPKSLTFVQMNHNPPKYLHSLADFKLKENVFKQLTYTTSDSKYNIQVTMNELFIPSDTNGETGGSKQLLSSLRINDNYFSENVGKTLDDYLDTYLSGYVDPLGQFITYTPDYASNYRFTSEFDWDKDNVGKYITNIYGQKHIGFNLKNNGGKIFKQLLDGTVTNDSYVPLEKIFLSVEYEKIIPFIYNLLFVTKPNNIIVWESNGKISNIDILLWDHGKKNKAGDKNPNINFKFTDDNSVKINGEHTIVNNSIWTIQRWVSNMPNLFMITDDHGNYMMYILPISKIKEDVRQKCVIDKLTFKKNNSDVTEFDRHQELLDGLQQFRIIQFNALTHMPIISDPEVLKQLCLSYACFNELGNIFELSNLIRKLKINLKTDKSNLFINEIDFSEFPKNEPLVFGSRFRIPSFARVSATLFASAKQQFSYKAKGKMSLENSYEHDYQFYDKINNFDEFMFNYYFQKNPTYMIPTLTEYYAYSLMQFKVNLGEVKMSDYAFSILFNRLKDIYEKYPPDLQEEFKTIISNLEKTKKYKCNPLEFFYQCVVGYIARDKQKDLVKLIIDDISDKSVQNNMSGGYKMLTEFVDGRFTYIDKQHNGGTIHNLLMGQGKTKMITPLVVLRYLQQKGLFDIMDSTTAGNHIYLILPENLVHQSYSFLSSTLSMYFPINVSKLSESRTDGDRGYSNSLTKSSKSNLELQLYVMSDTTMKCGMINNYSKVLENTNNHCYLFDEIDTVLDPTVSELNYPDPTTKTQLQGLSAFFDTVYDALYDIYLKPSQEILDIRNKYTNDFIMAPHFNVTNMSSNLVRELIMYVKNKLKDHLSNFENIIAALDLDFKEYDKPDDQINGDKKKLLDELIKKMTNSELQIAMSLHNLLNDAIPLALLFINRKNYGLDNTSLKNPIIVPFSYADKPMTGSNFSNPIVVMVLTMLTYMLPLSPLGKVTMNNMMQLIKKNYDQTPHDYKKYSNILIEYNNLSMSIELNELMNIESIDHISEEDVLKLRKSQLFTKMICNHNCSKYIKFESRQDNISGIDLMMSFNAKHRSGFTGTPNIPKFVDIMNDSGLVVLDESKETVDKISKVLDSVEIKIYDDKDVPIEYFKQVLDKNLDYNVVIDCGAILVGTTANQIYDEIIKRHTGLEQFIFWDNKDVPMSKDGNGIETQWNNGVGKRDGMFYYYDNRHTTGTDAIIPFGSKGIVLLGKNTRYRDVVQSMYRMRKLGIGHTVAFVMSTKIKQSINIKYKKDLNVNITNDILRKWFDDEELNYLNAQQKLMNVQNTLAIGRSSIFKKGDENLSYFGMNNVFTYPTIEKLKNTSTRLQALQIGNIITQKSFDVENTKQRITTILKNIREQHVNSDEITKLVNSSINDTSNYGISMVMEQQQEMSMEQSKDKQQQMVINIANIKVKPAVQNIISNKYIENYYDKINLFYYNEIIKDLVYVSKNLEYFDAPYITMHVDGIYFIVPYLEGYKIFDTFDNNKQLAPKKFLMMDSIGLIYPVSNINTEKDKLAIQTIGIFLNKKLNTSIYISIENYLTVYKLVNWNIFGANTMTIIDYILSINSESPTFKLFKESMIVYVRNTQQMNALIVKYNGISAKQDFYKALKDNENLFMKFLTYDGHIFRNINLE